MIVLYESYTWQLKAVKGQNHVNLI